MTQYETDTEPVESQSEPLKFYLPAMPRPSAWAEWLSTSRTRFARQRR